MLVLQMNYSKNSIYEIYIEISKTNKVFNLADYEIFV